VLVDDQISLLNFLDRFLARHFYDVLLVSEHVDDPKPAHSLAQLADHVVSVAPPWDICVGFVLAQRVL